MIVNAPYIEIYEYNHFNPQIINECVIDASEGDDSFNGNTIHFLNAYKYKEYRAISTEEVIDSQQNINDRIREITQVYSFIEENPDIFASSSEQFIVAEFEKMRNGLMQLSLDMLSTNISKEDECLFMYGQKNGIKLFFNLFFEKNRVETLVNVSTPQKQYVIEENIENSLQRLFQIFQEEETYGYLS